MKPLCLSVKAERLWVVHIGGSNIWSMNHILTRSVNTADTARTGKRCFLKATIPPMEKVSPSEIFFVGIRRAGHKMERDECENNDANGFARYSPLSLSFIEQFSKLQKRPTWPATTRACVASSVVMILVRLSLVWIWRHWHHLHPHNGSSHLTLWWSCRALLHTAVTSRVGKRADRQKARKSYCN